MDKEKCNHMLEVHNDTDIGAVYIIHINGAETIIEDSRMFDFCPLCGEDLNNLFFDNFFVRG